jgi:hypothetical protein
MLDTKHFIRGKREKGKCDNNNHREHQKYGSRVCQAIQIKYKSMDSANKRWKVVGNWKEATGYTGEGAKF